MTERKHDITLKHAIWGWHMPIAGVVLAASVALSDTALAQKFGDAVSFVKEAVASPVVDVNGVKQTGAKIGDAVQSSALSIRQSASGLDLSGNYPARTFRP